MIALLNLTPYTGALLSPSPNHSARKAPAIEGIVLHATVDEGNEDLSLSWMRSPRSRVSCHLLVHRSGDVTRLVGDQQRAWHAGVSWWRGTSDVNSITLGIEIANRNDGEPFTDAQYRRVAEIVAHYCRQGLTIEDVVGHADIAPGRRTDPFLWEWDRFRKMVREQLRTADVTLRASLRYDRRGGDRRVVSVAQAGRRPVAVPASQRASAISRAKPVPSRRTLWLNGLTLLATGSVIVGDTLDLAFWVGLSLPEEITMWALFGISVVNIGLRLRSRSRGRGAECTDAPSEAIVRVAERPTVHDSGGAAARPR